MKKLLCLSILITFISCDKGVGTDGIVINKITGERIEGVTVKMTSEQENANDTSDEKGYFNVSRFFSCGISSCNTDYKIKFSKTGYQDKTINESYYKSDEASYVNPEKKDTLIIKLTGI